MSIDTQLFEGKLIHLAPIDHDKDAEIEARWSKDLTLMRALSRQVAMPQSVAQMKKKYEAIEKEVEESKKLFYFTIRGKDDSRLLGFVRLEWIEWTHGTGNLRLAIGDPAERNKGYGTDAMALIMNIAFNELNLYRLSAILGEDNPDALRFFQRHGFIEEVRRLKAILRDGKTWDLIHLGILRDEWQSLAAKSEAANE
jgi:RimJ/RimL family protein N-acetyltransferase